MARARDLILKPQKRRLCTVKAVDGDTDLTFALILLPADVTTKIFDDAAEYAKKRGGSGAVEDPHFVRARCVLTLLAAAVDPDSPEQEAARYFDDTDQIRRMLDDAWIVHAFEQQLAFQTEFAPSPTNIRPEDYTTLIAASTEAWKTGGDPERPFGGLPPSTLRSLAATLVLRCTTLTQVLSELGSQTGSSSGDPTSSSSSVLSSEKPS